MAQLTIEAEKFQNYLAEEKIGKQSLDLLNPNKVKQTLAREFRVYNLLFNIICLFTSSKGIVTKVQKM